MMNNWVGEGVWLVLASGVLALSACGDQDTTTAFANEAALPATTLGELQLPLVTPTQQAYRLRQGLFDVGTRAGVLVATLDTEGELEASELRVELPQGPYDVTLRDGWTLEQLQENGAGTAVSAALISENPRAVEIRGGQVSSITYSFLLDQGVITLGEGALSVSLNVAEDAFFSDCYLLSSCGSGQSCLLADADGRTFCAEPGSLPVGASCSSQQCVSGAQCLGLDAAHPERRSCAQFCNTGASEWGCNCLSLDLPGQSFGVCGPPPEGSCDLLTQAGCAADEACQYHGGPFARCGKPGAVGAGAPCSGEECEAGMQCYDGFCRRFCDTRAAQNPDCPGYCAFVNTGNAGRCL